MQTEVYHLFHSGAAVKIKDKLFVFDYFMDKNEQEKELKSSLENGLIRKESFEGINQCYVFVSHSHHDHYNPVIFEWEKYCDNLNYILAEEVKAKKNIKEKNNIYFMEQDQELAVEEIKIESFGSTDQGISFLVSLGEMSIFHAGDLNWWKWKKFNEKVQKREEREYKREVDKLKDKLIDIAFVPVDPRLEENYYLAGEYFIKEIKPALFVPIHFAENYDVTKFFKKDYNSDQTRVAEIKQRGEKILYTR